MLEVVALTAVVLAVLCVGAALLVIGLARGKGDWYEDGPRRQVYALLPAAVVLLLLAGAVAAVDEKVADGGAPSPTATPTATPTPSAAEDYFADNMPNFKGVARLRSGRSPRVLCLVRYYARGRDPGANWWTTCDYNEELGSVAEVRNRLALLPDWGKRNARVIARVPAGEQLTYLRGKAARQCDDDGSPCYPGGGVQLLFDPEDFDRSWFVRFECTGTTEAAPADFESCTG